MRHVLNLFGHYSHVFLDMKNLNKRFITVIDQFGNKKKIRTEAEKARRRAEEQAKKVYKEKKCIFCQEIYLPFHQHCTKQWEISKYCSKKCKNASHISDPEYKKRKNDKRRGDKELHRRDYLRANERRGGTLWQVGSEKDREKLRERNRRRYRKLYGNNEKYTLERRANSSFQGIRRKKDQKANLLNKEQLFKCKEIRIKSRRLSKEYNIALHVDHLLPLRRGGREHPDNLMIMRKEANLFWGSRIKKCPWPKKENWNEPLWELEA